ncbi:MAG TPA: prepilin-type N-terminal cleavage/methylation domain-containing protein [Pyrinomonadaceae bacterium]|nr:prepilin-type N-terminal cleavage/methylation domain-containing protein [Pyrinomonadaceae bacterium]
MLSTSRKTLSHHSAAKAGGERGFTLLEVCIALLLLLIASIGVATAFAFSIQNNSSAGDRAVALALAQQRLERLRNLDFNNAALTAGVVTQDVTNANRPFRVVTTITDVDTDTSAAANAIGPTTKLIRVDVTPSGSSWTWANSIVTVVTTRSAFAPGPNFCGGC